MHLRYFLISGAFLLNYILLIKVQFNIKVGIFAALAVSP
jgi:hypothetical protein